MSSSGLGLASVDQNRITFTHRGVREWYVNGPLGLEQGFTLSRPPGAARSGPLTLALRVGGSLQARVGNRGASFLDRGGRLVLRYGALAVTDAVGHRVRSWLALGQGVMQLRVDDRGARYPLRIDPLIEGPKLTATGEIGDGRFGSTVALSSDGNTALVGAFQDNSNVGAAYVFTNTNGAWIQQARLTPDNETGAGNFGGQFGAVALASDGNTALIAAPSDDGAGRAWIFARSGSTWTQQGSGFSTGNGAISVALSGDGSTAAVDGNYGAQVFVRSGSTWTFQSALTPNDATNCFTGNCFTGGGVALSYDGNTAVVGGPSDKDSGGNDVGAVWIFTRSSGIWSQHGPKLTANDQTGTNQHNFGIAVALSESGTTALVGDSFDNSDRGAAWVFAPDTLGIWHQQGPKLIPNDLSSAGAPLFGQSVALTANGEGALIGAFQDSGGGALAGGAWVFTRTGTTWSQQGSRLTPDTETGAAGFGYSVALDGDGSVALIGGPLDHSNIGAAWIYSGSILPCGITCIQAPVPLPLAPIVTVPSSIVTISNLGATFVVFAVQARNTPLSAVTSRLHHRGTVFHFQLDQAATVKIKIQRKLPGRGVGRRCRPPSQRLRHKFSCTRLVTVATLTRFAHTGLNHVRFTGRIRRKALKSGRYQAVFTATDSAGASKPKTLSFTIVAR